MPGHSGNLLSQIKAVAHYPDLANYIFMEAN